MGHLLLWDHVLWSFLLGFTPLALSLGWKLVTGVADLLWHRDSQDPRAGYTNEATLPSSVSKLSSSGSSLARPVPTETH